MKKWHAKPGRRLHPHVQRRTAGQHESRNGDAAKGRDGDAASFTARLAIRVPDSTPSFQRSDQLAASPYRHPERLVVRLASPALLAAMFVAFAAA